MTKFECPSCGATVEAIAREAYCLPTRTGRDERGYEHTVRKHPRTVKMRPVEQVDVRRCGAPA